METLLQIGISVNVLIAIGYFLLSAFIVFSAFNSRLLRALSVAGSVFAGFIVLFLVGCGMHHLEFGVHGIEGSVGVNNLIHLLIIDGIQIVGAFGATIVFILYSNTFSERIEAELSKIIEEKSSGER
jgi:hypothetical protein